MAILKKGRFPTYTWWEKMYFSDLKQVRFQCKFKYGKLYLLIYLRLYQQE